MPNDGKEKGHKTHTGKKPTGVKKLVANLEVTVKDKTDGKSIKDVEVQILSPEYIKGITVAGGKAKFTGVIRGEYKMILVHDKYFKEAASTTVTVAPDKIVENKFETKLQRYPHFESKTTGNRIDIVFDPDNSKKVTKCKKIVHVQFILMLADGKAIKPGDYYSGYKYRDNVTTSDHWYVDHLASEKTPDYQQGVGNGKKNGGSSKAKIYDVPTTGGGDKGFYNAASNAGGWKTIVYEFFAFAWCMDGDECGTWYEGIQWEYKKTHTDNAGGNSGAATIKDYNVEAPSKSHIEAFKKFNKEKGFEPCK